MFIFQTNTQVFGSINWLQLIPLLLVIGGLISFIAWERRKKSLELEKLELQIEELKQSEFGINIPNSDEINRTISDIKTLQTEMKRWERAGATESRAFERLKEDLERAEKKLEELLHTGVKNIIQKRIF
jgi:hypothetical protein